MGIHVVIQPLAGYGAEVVSPSPGVRQLVAGCEGTPFSCRYPPASAACRTQRDSHEVWLQRRAHSVSGAKRRTAPVRIHLRWLTSGPV
jgi:hypothetical protein